MKALITASGLIIMTLLLLVTVIIEAITPDPEPAVCEIWSEALDEADPTPVTDSLSLTTHQTANARIILGVTNGLGLTRRAAVIALATALQESSLRNLAFGDIAGPDSRGLYQQRTTSYPEIDRLNPAEATTAFLNRLIEVENWSTIPLTQAAQAVQISAHPNAYARWEAPADAIAELWWRSLDNPTECAPQEIGGIVGIEDTTVVGGIRVHTSLANDLRRLLADAARQGHNFTGWGWRDSAAQIRLRRQNCGPTDYDIYERPSSQCSPPTARPGRSMHEQGLAIDFRHNGRSISTRNNAGYRWLRDNAASYGLLNLPSEPWHWSRNGR